MTLSTNIYILGPVDGPDLHAWVNENILRVKNPIVTEGHRDDYHYLHNAIGQGFDAIFELDWWDTPQLMTDGLTDKDDPDDVEYYTKKQEAIGAPYYAHIDFDTAYGYSKNGMGCTELHASWIVRLYREYFEPRGLEIAWQDEYSGKVWRNLSEEGMTDFLGGGDAAMNWFTSVVRPAITEEFGEENVTWPY